MNDIINAIFECSGGFFVFLSILQLIKDKRVAGVSPWCVGFFMSWGYWNMYYYPSLDQFWSGIGAIGVAITNTIWLYLLLYYWRNER